MLLRRTRPLYPGSRPTARAGYSSSRLPSLGHLLTIFVQRGGQPAAFSSRVARGSRRRRLITAINLYGSGGAIILLITAANPLNRRVPPRRREAANECVGACPLAHARTRARSPLGPAGSASSPRNGWGWPCAG